MKKICLIFILFILFPVVAFADGQVSVSPSSLTIAPGKTKTFKITASNAAGRVDISSSNEDVVSVSKTSEWLDNSSVSITVKANSIGSGEIYINLSDVATYDGEVLTGKKVVKVNVKEITTTTKIVEEIIDVEPKIEEPTKPVDKSIKNLKIVGYDIDFSTDKKEYTVNVSEDVTALYIIVESDVKYANIGEVNIKDISSFVISSDDNTENIKININRKKENKNNDENCILLIVMSNLLVLIVITGAYIIKLNSYKNKTQK